MTIIPKGTVIVFQGGRVEVDSSIDSQDVRERLRISPEKVRDIEQACLEGAKKGASALLVLANLSSKFSPKEIAYVLFKGIRAIGREERLIEIMEEGADD